MNSFTALDEVLNAGAITPAASREVASAASFQPLFAGALAKPEETRLSNTTACEPQVELVQTEGRIQQIVVTCRCGERTVLDCAYSE